MTDEFTLPLAILDFLPVLFTGIGLFYIVRMIFSVLPSQGSTAFLGGFMIVAGGLFRAVWKLLIVLSGGSLIIDWMGNSLFVLMAAGYIFVGWSLWQFSRSIQAKPVFHAWLMPLLLVLGVWGISFYLANVQADSTAWKSILISMTVVGNLVDGILLIVFAYRQKLFKAGWLFLINLMVVFVMNGLARVADQTVMVHWVAESVNSVSILCYAIASWTVYRHTQSDAGIGSSAGQRLTALAK